MKSVRVCCRVVDVVVEELVSRCGSSLHKGLGFKGGVGNHGGNNKHHSDRQSQNHGACMPC